ncbi:unnamed protein product [Rhizophagus irregularis]|nr:unnamed protein product [Rhizophagus irregularis]
MWVCICAGKSKSKNNSEQINAQALSQQELFLMQCDKDRDRKKNQPRKGIWTKDSNKLSCPRALYAVQYFNTITREPESIIQWVSLLVEMGHSIEEIMRFEKCIENIIQKFRHNSHLDANDKISTELLLKNLSCLESKQSPFNVENLSPNNSILFWQQQQCLCYKDSKEKGCYKSANCNPFICIIQTQEMRNSCKKINWDMCCLDATGSTNQYRWLLYSIIIGDEGGHGIPLAFMITSWESHEPITKFFEVLHITNGIAFSPKVFIIDKSDTEILAINIFYKEQKVLIFLCFFHYMQAWERWCRNSANRISLDVRPTVIAFVRKLKLVITIEGFNQLEQDFIKWILTTNNLTKLLSYYKKSWLKFNEIKSRELKACEIAENNMIDIIDPMNGYCIVKSQSNSSKVYEVYLCDVTVKTSPLLCKHIRAAASVLEGLEIWNLSLDSERIAFYQNNNMMQDQYTQSISINRISWFQ